MALRWDGFALCPCWPLCGTYWGAGWGKFVRCSQWPLILTCFPELSCRARESSRGLGDLPATVFWQPRRVCDVPSMPANDICTAGSCRSAAYASLKAGKSTRAFDLYELPVSHDPCRSLDVVNRATRLDIVRLGENSAPGTSSSVLTPKRWQASSTGMESRLESLLRTFVTLLVKMGCCEDVRKLW